MSIKVHIRRLDRFSQLSEIYDSYPRSLNYYVNISIRETFSKASSSFQVQKRPSFHGLIPECNTKTIALLPMYRGFQPPRENFPVKILSMTDIHFLDLLLFCLKNSHSILSL
jgi:hypothetical protein